MGWKCVPQVMGLVRGDGMRRDGKGQAKHRANVAAIIHEAFEIADQNDGHPIPIRKSASDTYDRSRTPNNRYTGYQTADDVVAALEEEATAQTVEVQKKDENGNPIYDEDGNPVLEPDGESDYYYFTGIVVDGEEQGENLTENKVASGSIPKADESSVQYTNRVILYELPESGGSGTNLYTMAGISFLLMAGLMYRKKFRERRAGSSRN